MDLIVDQHLSNSYNVTKTSEHSFLLENEITHQKWNIEILDENLTDITGSIRGRTN